jgi:hypothetical protein
MLLDRNETTLPDYRKESISSQAAKEGYGSFPSSPRGIILEAAAKHTCHEVGENPGRQMIGSF